MVPCRTCAVRVRVYHGRQVTDQTKSNSQHLYRQKKTRSSVSLTWTYITWTPLGARPTGHVSEGGDWSFMNRVQSNSALMKNTSLLFCGPITCRRGHTGEVHCAMGNSWRQGLRHSDPPLNLLQGFGKPPLVVKELVHWRINSLAC